MFKLGQRFRILTFSPFSPLRFLSYMQTRPPFEIRSAAVCSPPLPPSLPSSMPGVIRTVECPPKITDTPSPPPSLSSEEEGKPQCHPPPSCNPLRRIQIFLLFLPPGKQKGPPPFPWPMTSTVVFFSSVSFRQVLKRLHKRLSSYLKPPS